MAKLFIPAPLRDKTGGDDVVDLPGRDVGEMLDALDARFPGTKSRLVQGTSLRPGLAIVIGSRFAVSGLSEPVTDDDEVHIIPAIAGG